MRCSRQDATPTLVNISSITPSSEDDKNERSASMVANAGIISMAIPVTEKIPNSTNKSKGMSDFVDASFASFDKSFNKIIHEVDSNDTEKSQCLPLSVNKQFFIIFLSVILGFLIPFLLCLRVSPGGIRVTNIVQSGSLSSLLTSLLRPILIGHILRFGFLTAYNKLLHLEPDEPDGSKSDSDDDQDSFIEIYFNRYLKRLDFCLGEYLFGDNQYRGNNLGRGSNSKSSNRTLAYHLNVSNFSFSHDITPPPFLLLMGALTLAAFIVHPDGFTWILLLKLREGIISFCNFFENFSYSVLIPRNRSNAFISFVVSGSLTVFLTVLRLIRSFAFRPNNEEDKRNDNSSKATSGKMRGYNTKRKKKHSRKHHHNVNNNKNIDELASSALHAENSHNPEKEMNQVKSSMKDETVISQKIEKSPISTVETTSSVHSATKIKQPENVHDTNVQRQSCEITLIDTTEELSNNILKPMKKLSNNFNTHSLSPYKNERSHFRQKQKQFSNYQKNYSSAPRSGNKQKASFYHFRHHAKETDTSSKNIGAFSQYKNKQEIHHQAPLFHNDVEKGNKSTFQSRFKKSYQPKNYQKQMSKPKRQENKTSKSLRANSWSPSYVSSPHTPRSTSTRFSRSFRKNNNSTPQPVDTDDNLATLTATSSTSTISDKSRNVHSAPDRKKPFYQGLKYIPPPPGLGYNDKPNMQFGQNMVDGYAPISPGPGYTLASPNLKILYEDGIVNNYIFNERQGVNQYIQKYGDSNVDMLLIPLTPSQEHSGSNVALPSMNTLPENNSTISCNSSSTTTTYQENYSNDCSLSFDYQVIGEQMAISVLDC